jgi:pentatricopeptide repeat protein
VILFFETMEPLYGLKPDKYAYAAIFWACWTSGEWQRAVAYIEKMEVAGCTPDSVIYTTLINMYEANGQFDEAMRVLERMGNT